MNLKPEDVAAVCVTRGDVAMDEITESWFSFGIGEPLIWNNSLNGTDLSVYGRWQACLNAHRNVILVQDDDCVLPHASLQALLDNYRPGIIVANTPERFRDRYTEHCLVGFGAIFDRDLVAPTFRRFFAKHPEIDRAWFRDRSDVVFTALNERHLLDLPYEDLPHAYADNRMWKAPGHGPQRETMLRLALEAR